MLYQPLYQWPRKAIKVAVRVKKLCLRMHHFYEELTRYWRLVDLLGMLVLMSCFATLPRKQVSSTKLERLAWSARQLVRPVSSCRAWWQLAWPVSSSSCRASWQLAWPVSSSCQATWQLVWPVSSSCQVTWQHQQRSRQPVRHHITTNIFKTDSLRWKIWKVVVLFFFKYRRLSLTDLCPHILSFQHWLFFFLYIFLKSK